MQVKTFVPGDRLVNPPHFVLRSGLPALLDSEYPGLPFFDGALSPINELADPYTGWKLFCCHHIFDRARRYAEASDE